MYMSTENKLFQQFHDEGYVVFKNALNADLLNKLNQQCEQLTDLYMEKYSNIVSCSSRSLRETKDFKLLDFFNNNRNYCPRANRKDIDLDVIKKLFFEARFYNFAKKVLNSEDGLVLFQEYSIRSVVPHSFSENITGWHQDASDKNPDLEMVIFWAPISGAETGGLKIIPKSHRLGAVEHSDTPPFYHVKNAILDNYLDGEISLDLEPGDCVMFHHHMFHTARANLSNKIRWSIDFRYQTLSQFERKRVGLIL